MQPSLSDRLRERILALQQGLDDAARALATKATSQRIHDARVAGRRLRSLLHTFRHDLCSKAVKRYRRELKVLTHGLEEAREADVTRRGLARLTGPDDSVALKERLNVRYSSALQRLHATVAAATWRRRLLKLRRLSMLASLVPVNDELAAIAIKRRVSRRVRSLRQALCKAGKSAKRLHRLRLRVKGYLLEDCGAEAPLQYESELPVLQRLQDCLGDIHDEEILHKTLGARGMSRRGTRAIIKELRRRKRKLFKDFKRCRNDLMEQ